MATNTNKLLKLALWAAVALLALIVFWPKPPAAAMPPIAGLPTLPTPPIAPARTIAGSAETKPDDLALRLFGVTYHEPTKKPQLAGPVKTPAPMPVNTNIKFLGVAMVEGLRKIIFSDINNKISFAISPGEKYAGWTCVSIGESEAILSREGNEYRVLLK